VIAARDIVDLLRANGFGHASVVVDWLNAEFPKES
jgi:hypothetical protein